MNRRLQSETVQMLWDVAGSADPDLNRPLVAYLCVLPMSEDDVRVTVADLLAVFERLGEERPDVVVPFLGTLLNRARGRCLVTRPVATGPEGRADSWRLSSPDAPFPVTH